MFQYWTKIALTALMVISMMSSAGLAATGYIQTMPNVTSDMLQAEYWIQKTEDPNRAILDPAQIESYNRQIISSIPDIVYDLLAYPTQISKDQLVKMVDYQIPDYPCYIGSITVDEGYWQQIKIQMNLSGIQDQNKIKYGLTVNRCNLKALPTQDIIGDEPDDPAFDLFQNTALLPAEPVVILHQSQDGRLLFVQMYNYTGWLPAVDVAVCSRDAWVSFQQEPNYLVVTGNHLQLDQDPLLPMISQLDISMGTKLPLVGAESIPSSIRGRTTLQNYVVKLPMRNGSGQLELVMVPIPINADVSLGYLPYTRANVIRQAFKMQGDRYGWGGMLNGRDCSSMVMEIYRCFGFRLARDANQQEASGREKVAFTGAQNRETLLGSLEPGSMLYFPGHEMIYLGLVKDRYYVISALGSYGELHPGQIKPVSKRIRTVVINDLNITRASGIRWIDSLTSAITIK